MEQKTEDSPKQPLADALRHQFHRKSLAISAIADLLGVPRPSLYTWMDRNNFPRDIVLRLAQAAGIEAKDLDQLEARFSFSSPAPRERRSFSSPSSADPDTSLFSGSTEGDLFIRLSCAEPTEWHPSFWTTTDHRDMVAALRRGARMLYLFPTDAELARWTATTGVQSLPGDGDVAHAFARFARTVHAEVRETADCLALIRGAAAPFYFPFGTITLGLSASTSHAFFDCQTLVGANQVMTTRLVLPGRVAQQVGRVARSAVGLATLPNVWSSAIARLDALLDDSLGSSPVS